MRAPTGPVLADLLYTSGNVPDAGGGNIMKKFVGRTVPSGDGLHTVTVFVTNDEATWMLRRPQDFPRAEIAGLVEAARRSANVPGSTYFMPVNELTALYLNILLSAFSSDFRYFIVDERRGFRPAGIAKFARSNGGTLYDDPREGQFVTVGFLEAGLFEMIKP